MENKEIKNNNMENNMIENNKSNNNWKKLWMVGGVTIMAVVAGGVLRQFLKGILKGQKNQQPKQLEEKK